MCEIELYVDGEKYSVAVPDNNAPAHTKRKKIEKKKDEVDTQGASLAQLPGMIVEFKKQNGDEVKAVEIVVVIEAIKMMNNFEAPADGILRNIKFQSGDTVAKNDVLFAVDPIA